MYRVLPDKSVYVISGKSFGALENCWCQIEVEIGKVVPAYSEKILPRRVITLVCVKYCRTTKKN
jgi:hypothetical protein